MAAPGTVEQHPTNESPIDAAWKAAAPRDDKDLELILDAWKKTVDVQMHFNDICMRIRNLAITVLVGAIGLAGYSMKEPLELNLQGRSVPIGTVIVLAGLLGWIAFYGMDGHWYHVFLRAAGFHATAIEKRWQDKVPELLLSSRIGEASKRTRWGIDFDSTKRLNWFYAIGAIVLVLAALLAWKVHPRVAPDGKGPTAGVQSKPVNPTSTPARR